MLDYDEKFERAYKQLNNDENSISTGEYNKKTFLQEISETIKDLINGTSGEDTKLYKETIIKKFMNELFPNLNYVPDLEIRDKMFIIDEVNKNFKDSYHLYSYNIDDYIYGDIEDSSFEICDLVETYEEKTTDSYIYRSICTLFTHITLKNKKECNIFIRSKNERYIENFKNDIKLDNKDFNENYVVIADNNVVVYEVLTTELIQLILEQREKIDFDTVIKNNNIYFKFYTHTPIFEIDQENGTISKEKFYEYYQLLNFAIDFSKKVEKIYKDTEI